MPSAATQVRVPCAICATEFVQKHRRQRYCSKRCLWKSKNDAAMARNPERIRELNRASYWRHREDRVARSLAYHTKHRARLIEAQRANAYRARLETPWKSLVSEAERRAKKRGLAFNLTDAWAKEKWTGRCALTEIVFILTERGSGPKFFSPSIDRVEPKLGYVQSNCRFILHAVNAMKGSKSDAEVLLVCEAIVRKLRS